MMDLAAKTKGLDPKPLRAIHFGTTAPLRFKYTYDI